MEKKINQLQQKKWGSQIGKFLSLAVNINEFVYDPRILSLIKKVAMRGQKTGMSYCWFYKISVQDLKQYLTVTSII